MYNAVHRVDNVVYRVYDAVNGVMMQLIESKLFQSS